MLTQDVLQEGLLKLGDLAGLHLVQVSPHASIDDRYLLFDGHGSCQKMGNRVSKSQGPYFAS